MSKNCSRSSRNSKNLFLLDYLHAAFDEMTAKQRRAVFANAVRQRAKAMVTGRMLLSSRSLVRGERT